MQEIGNQQVTRLTTHVRYCRAAGWMGDLEAKVVGPEIEPLLDS